MAKELKLEVGSLIECEADDISYEKPLKAYVVSLYNGKPNLVEVADRIFEDGDPTEPVGWRRDHEVPASWMSRGSDRYIYGSDIEEWKVISSGGKRVAPKWALKYDLDEDPVEFFAEKESLVARLRDLVDNRRANGLKLDSIYVYELKSETKIEVDVSVRFKGL